MIRTVFKRTKVEPEKLYLIRLNDMIYATWEGGGVLRLQRRSDGRRFELSSHVVRKLGTYKVSRNELVNWKMTNFCLIGKM